MQIETGRLKLRQIEMADLDEFAALHADPEVTRFVRPLDRAAARERLELAGLEWAQQGYGMLAVLDRATDRFLGRTGLKHWPQFDEIELGWILRRDVWGQGYATEAAGACADWAFRELDLPCLTAMIHPANVRSVGVAERLGFKPLREDVLLGDPVVVHGRRRGD
jgi:RimJ/RimL family protein N-acetyltransferase